MEGRRGSLISKVLAVQTQGPEFNPPLSMLKRRDQPWCLVPLITELSSWNTLVVPALGAQSGGSLGSLPGQPGVLGKFQANERPVSKNKVEGQGDGSVGKGANHYA